MNTYPAIYKSVEGSEYLYQNKDSYYCYERQIWDSSEPHHDCHHSDKNITAEYLANTYGEVKSKEHAEFIKLLAEVNKVVVCDVRRDSHKFFAVIDSSLLFLNSGAIAMKDGRKQITIPLPSESNTNTPEEDFEMKQVAKNNGDNLIFGDADKCEEWPCVNDEVLTSDGNGVVKLLPDSKGYYVVSINGEYYQYQLYELEKPKTTEQELRDELKEIIHTAMTNNFGFLNGTDSKLVDYMIDNYNITKKPQ